MVTLSGASSMVLRTQSLQLSQFSPTMPAIRSMLICSKPEVAGPAVGAVDLVLQVGPAVVLQDLRLEVLDAQAQPGDAELAQRFELVLLQRARLALEGDFRGLVPRQDRLEPRHQPAKLGGAQVRRRAAAEVDVVQRPAADDAASRRSSSTSFTRASR